MEITELTHMEYSTGKVIGTLRARVLPNNSLTYTYLNEAGIEEEKAVEALVATGATRFVCPLPSQRGWLDQRDEMIAWMAINLKGNWKFCVASVAIELESDASQFALRWL